MVTPRARSMLWGRSAWRSEELESDAIGISEAHTRAIGCVLDPTVDDAKFVKSAGPGLQLGSVGATEGDMIETDPMLAELLGGCRLFVLVQADERRSQQVHGVVKARIGVFIEHRFCLEQGFVPR